MQKTQSNPTFQTQSYLTTLVEKMKSLRLTTQKQFPGKLSGFWWAFKNHEYPLITRASSNNNSFVWKRRVWNELYRSLMKSGGTSPTPSTPLHTRWLRNLMAFYVRRFNQLLKNYKWNSCFKSLAASNYLGTIPILIKKYVSQFLAHRKVYQSEHQEK